jgi:glycosyltransferase involved in cell wall biosynthesis
LRLLLLRATTDVWVAVSEHTREVILAGTGIACRCIANGVSVEKVGLSPSVAREELGLPSGPVVGVVGRLSPEKGVDRLVEVMGAEALHGSVLAVIGEGEDRDRLETLARTIEADIRFCGSLKDARRYFPAFDLLVIPSRSEGLPMVLLEAMAEGVAVAVADVGGCAAVVEGGCGWLLSESVCEWPQMLADALSQVRGERAAEQIAKARARVVDSYSAQRVVAEYEAIYESLQT